MTGAAAIFDFWSEVEHGAHVHPADVKTFERMDAARHGFNLQCLPGCFAGRLRTASVVFLYLSPGFDPTMVDAAKTNEAKDFRMRSYTGNEPFRDHGPGRAWVEARMKPFGEFESVRDQCAVLNIGAYPSKDVKSYASLLALPSSRLSLSWAQDYLFAEAEAERRIVICMRSAAYWGFDTGRNYKGTLFAPEVGRSGHLYKTAANQELIARVRQHLAKLV
jgi:hypothetical protein